MSEIDLTTMLRQKANGERDSLGLRWGDWICDEAAARIEAQAALIAEMTEALRPFCFFDADHPKTDTTQRAWDIRYTDRFQDWIGFDDIEAARDALSRAEEAQK